MNSRRLWPECVMINKWQHEYLILIDVIPIRQLISYQRSRDQSPWNHTDIFVTVWRERSTRRLELIIFIQARSFKKVAIYASRLIKRDSLLRWTLAIASVRDYIAHHVACDELERLKLIPFVKTRNKISPNIANRQQMKTVGHATLKPRPNKENRSELQSLWNKKRRTLWSKI